MRCTASAAISAGLDHAPDGQRGPQLLAALVQVTAEQRGGQRRVNEARRDEVDPDRRHFDGQVGDQRGQRGGARRHDRQAGPTAACDAGHEQQRAAGPHPADGVLGDRDGQPLVVVEVPVGPVAVQVSQGRVVRAGTGDHHVVDWLRQAAEEPAERIRVGGVERRAAARAELGRGLLEPAGVAGGQDDLGSFGAGPPGGFQPDAGAAADHDDGLPGQFGSAWAGRGIGRGGHDSSSRIRPGRPSARRGSSMIALRPSGRAR